MKLNKEEAKILFKVLDVGMPDRQSDRDKVSKIWYKLAKFINTKK